MKIAKIKKAWVRPEVRKIELSDAQRYVLFPPPTTEEDRAKK